MRVCSTCGEKLLVKDTAREHNHQGSYTYTCRDCYWRWLGSRIAATRRQMGLS